MSHKAVVIRNPGEGEILEQVVVYKHLEEHKEMSSRQHLVCLSRTECQISFCVRIDSFICEVSLTLTFLWLLTLAHMTMSSMSQTMWETRSGWNYFRLNWWKAQILYHSQSFTVEMGCPHSIPMNGWWQFGSFFHQKGQHVTGTAFHWDSMRTGLHLPWKTKEISWGKNKQTRIGFSKDKYKILNSGGNNQMEDTR